MGVEGTFSNRVQDVIRLSREEAIRLGHDCIGTEHMLLGIIREGEGIAVKILRNLGADLYKIKKAIEDTVRSSGTTLTIGQIPLTKQAEKVLKITYLEAKIYKSDVVGTEHLLLSLLRDNDNLAAQVLTQFAVSYDGVRTALDKLIRGDIKIHSDEKVWRKAKVSINRNLLAPIGCQVCGVVFAVPNHMLPPDEIEKLFYCPNGHQLNLKRENQHGISSV